MRFDVISVFPGVCDAYMDASIMGRAQARGLVEFHAHDLRRWTHDRHNTVDDAPFGGGQGMLMKPAPIFEAVEAVLSEGDVAREDTCVVFFSPVGNPYDQKTARELSEFGRIVMVCGRYEGMDERAYELADRIVSIGDYVLTGGELAALVVADSVSRLVPGVLGDEMSAEDESFSHGLLEYAQYTRPAVYEGKAVPDVLLSGNHGEIAKWRRANALERTALLRPDLLASADLTDEERARAEELTRGR
jgi:tRNA (guanine37-N1)-methyltransferase